MLTCKVKLESSVQCLMFWWLFVLVVSTCSSVHTSLCLCKSNFRCILVYLYVFKTGPKLIQQHCLWVGVIINCCSSDSLHLKIMWQTLSSGFLQNSLKSWSSVFLSVGKRCASVPMLCRNMSPLHWLKQIRSVNVLNMNFVLETKRKLPKDVYFQ